MNALQNFNFNNHPVRVQLIDNEPHWIAKDVCDVLSIQWNGLNTLSQLDPTDEYRETIVIDSIGRKQTALAVNESGLYTLILRSNKPEAKAFRKWVTSEVLPQIRKTGSYSIRVPKTLPEALRAYAAEVEAHEKAKLQLIVQQPKVDLADKCLIAVNSRSMGDTAKALGIGRNTLFSILREESILMETNIPYQRYINAGWFEVKITPKDQKGLVVNYPVTMVMPKGLEKIRELLAERKAA